MPENNIRLSPTKISCYYECPRKFFYRYVRELPEKVRPPLVRGRITHKVLENFFDFVKLSELGDDEHWLDWAGKFQKILLSLLKSEWDQIGKSYKDCFTGGKQKQEMFEETKEFLDFYAIKLAFSLHNKLKELDKDSEWFTQNIRRHFFPKDRELRLELEDEAMAGFIDKTMSIFGKGIAIVDYKTSKCPLPHRIPKEHLKQGKAYAFMWMKSFNELPRFISFYYMREGESVFYPISEKDIKEIEDDIKEIRSKKLDVKEFSKKKSRLCDFCDFKPHCFKKKSGSEEIKSKAS